MNKSTGPHKTSRLTDRAIRAISERGRYPDGDSLYLVADNKTAKRWVLRTIVQGKRRDIGLGSYRNVSLAEARDLARQYRKVARNGEDPRIVLRGTRSVPTFESHARQYYEQHKNMWRNPKHRRQWISTLEQYAFPTIGDRRVDEITTPDIVTLLSPIWFEKRETARRVKQRISTVLDDAKGRGHVYGENPVAGVSASLKEGKTHRPRHFKAMDFHDLPEFVRWLRASNSPSMTRLALEWTILNAARTGETIGATWDEISTDKALWSIPAERMKAGFVHRVPLCDRSLEILDQVRPITCGGRFVFEGQQANKPLSNMAMLQFLRRNNISATVHGMRTCFRNWCSEESSFPHAVIEKCLAHTIRNKAEAAYHQSEYLDKRRKVMRKWAKFVGGK